MSFTKVHQSILQSSLWSEDSDTKVVWFTLLALADKHGEVMASVPGLARTAGVPMEKCQAALQKFLSPDAHSRTPDLEGRRIEAIDGGWALVNYLKYRREASKEDAKTKHAERQRRYREKILKRHAPSHTVTRDATVTRSDATVTHNMDNAEAEADAEADAYNKLSPAYGASKVEKHEPARSLAERPSLDEIKAYAAQIGLAPWKAEDWFNEMEACGWLDFNHRPVAKWQPMLVRVKTKWEADGRPTAPPASKTSPAANGAQRGPSPFGPPISAVKEYAREKDDGTGRAVANALHWFAFWEKRGWKRKNGTSLDWKVELSAHLANSVGVAALRPNGPDQRPPT